MNLSTLALAVGILCAIAAPASAITNGTRPADHDFRFDAVGALATGHFLGLDPDHPNAFDHNWWCTATLITPEIALTAAHCITDPGAEGIHAVRFRRHTDGSLGTKAEGPESFHHARVDHFEELPGDALAIFLEEPVLHIDPIPVLMAGTEDLPSDLPVYNAGWGKEGPGHNEGPRNELLLCDTTVSSSSSGGISFRNQAAAGGCGVNMHDSGSPLLYENEKGELRAIGGVTTTHTAVNYAAFRNEPDPGFEHTPYRAADFIVQAKTRAGIYEPGESVVIVTLVENVGTRVRGRFPVRVELVGTEGVVQTWYIRSTSVRLGSWQRHVLNLSESLPVGTYTFTVTADPFDAVDEYFEFNNHWEGNSADTTVTPASGEVERATISPVIFDDSSFAMIVTAERDDGTVAIVSVDQNGESFGRSRIRPDASGRFRFKQNGRTYLITFGMEVSIETSADDATIWEPTEYATTGQMAHLQGIYTDAPSFTRAPSLGGTPGPRAPGRLLSAIRTELVAITMADGNVYLASSDGTIGAAGNTDRETQEVTFFMGEAEASMSWDPEFDTHRMKGYAGRLRFDLDLEVP